MKSLSVFPYEDMVAKLATGTSEAELLADLMKVVREMGGMDFPAFTTQSAVLKPFLSANTMLFFEISKQVKSLTGNIRHGYPVL